MADREKRKEKKNWGEDEGPGGVERKKEDGEGKTREKERERGRERERERASERATERERERE